MRFSMILFSMILGGLLGIFITDTNTVVEQNKKMLSWANTTNKQLEQVFVNRKINIPNKNKYLKMNSIEKNFFLSTVSFKIKNKELINEIYPIYNELDKKVKTIDFSNNVFFYIYLLTIDAPEERLSLFKFYIH